MSRPLDLDLLGPGCTIWESLSVRRDADGNRIGGVIVEIHDGGRDLETGEITVRRFRCLDPYRNQRDHLLMPVVLERDVDPDALEAPERRRLSICILRLMDGVMHHHRRATATLSPEEVQWARWIGTLAQVIEGKR